MATVLWDKGPVDSSLPVKDFSQLMGVLNQLTGCLSLLVVVPLLPFLHHSGVGSVVSSTILLMSA